MVLASSPSPPPFPAPLFGLHCQHQDRTQTVMASATGLMTADSAAILALSSSVAMAILSCSAECAGNVSCSVVAVRASEPLPAFAVPLQRFWRPDRSLIEGEGVC